MTVRADPSFAGSLTAAKTHSRKNLTGHFTTISDKKAVFQFSPIIVFCHNPQIFACFGVNLPVGVKTNTAAAVGLHTMITGRHRLNRTGFAFLRKLQQSIRCAAGNADAVRGYTAYQGSHCRRATPAVSGGKSSVSRRFALAVRRPSRSAWTALSFAVQLACSA